MYLVSAVKRKIAEDCKLNCHVTTEVEGGDS